MKAILYTNEQFREASRIERLYMYLLEPEAFVLTNAESEHLEKLKAAFSLFCSAKSKKEMYRKFDEQYSLWASQRLLIFKESQELFGKFEEINVKVERSKEIAHLDYAIKLARKDKASADIVKAVMARSRLTGTQKTETEAIVKKPIKITFISDDSRTENPALPEAN